ncbi:restriction endonuclease subunit S [uncultured Aquimarina sp.]|uniref:restriction endonuclease subunit S n=1 Tax=uncultured Aquimarina sp. TaxID=575652 RepID=UPI0026055F7A|nr:restriction endonuclease subunit S [uncultured Aquimarina sp.]
MSKFQKHIFKDIAKFIDYRGRTPKKTDSGIPLITAKNVRMDYISDEPKEFIAEDDYESWMTRGIPKIGDVLFSTEAPLGNVAQLKTSKKIALAQRLVTFQPINDTYISTFLKYYLMSSLFQTELLKKATGTTVKGIKTSILKKFEIPLPSLNEQRKIVDKLNELFVRINKAIVLLEENVSHSQDLMSSVLDGLFDKVAEKYPSVSLADHICFIGGSQPPKSSFSGKKKDGYVRLIQIRDYKSDNYIVYIDEKSTKKFCTKDDVMIGRYGPPVFQILRGLEGAYNVALMKAIPDEKVIMKDYLYYFLMNGRIQNYIISISQRSAGQSGVNKKALEAYEIAIPPLEEQQRIVDKIKAAIPKIEETQKLVNRNLDHLKALKSSLLDKAFKGELL